MDDSGWQFRFSIRHLALLFVVTAGLLTWYVFPDGTLPKKTGRELDFAIFGHGWLEVADDSGRVFYTRYGSLSINPDGNLVAGRVQDGLIVDPPINVPGDWRTIHISLKGEVTAEAGDSVQPITLGMLQLAKFINPEGLKEQYPGIYTETVDSGSATLGQPGTAGFGFVRQGWLQYYDPDFNFSLSDLCLVFLICISGWNLYEIRKLKQQVEVAPH